LSTADLWADALGLRDKRFIWLMVSVHAWPGHLGAYGGAEDHGGMRDRGYLFMATKMGRGRGEGERKGKERNIPSKHTPQ
jgi:hypothetical protein